MMRGIEEKYEFPYLTKSGEFGFVRALGTPLYDEQKQIVGALLFGKDITQEKKIKKAQNHLMVSLKQVNKNLQNFALIVSHDLKAPLKAIRIILDLLLLEDSSLLKDSTKIHLFNINEKIDMMLRLIDGVLEFSKVSYKEKSELIDLAEIIEEVKTTISIPDHIKIVILNDLPTIRFEKVKLFQIMQNLLSNAIKYNDKVNGQITISSSSQDLIKGNIEIQVADNGIGIQEEYQHKIFDLFETVDRKWGKFSTGVGLTIVKFILEQVGGSIRVESIPDEGSKFTVTIPVKKDH